MDQALLETADKTGLITLRFYRWSEPTLSLGYFQSHLDRRLHVASQDCPIVRRRSGGGAILHDQELTYSLSVPSTNRWSSRNGDLYRMMHQILIEIFNANGANSSLFESSPCNLMDDSSPVADRSNKNSSNARSFNVRPPAEVDPKAFMCFRRRTSGDIVISGHKVVGSAQRRSKKALLQHGSILMNCSPSAPELMGVQDLCDYALHGFETVKKCSDSIASALRLTLKNGMLSASEKSAATTAAGNFFGSDDWNLHR